MKNKVHIALFIEISTFSDKIMLSIKLLYQSHGLAFPVEIVSNVNFIYSGEFTHL